MRSIFSRLYVERNHDLRNAIIIAGTGRSGTTWLARILEKCLHYRIIFEPFYPQKVAEFSQFKHKKYLRPSDDYPEFRSVVERILTGRVRNAWMDQINRSFIPKGRIVKTIRANFFLKWIRNNFPEVPIIYILRHPCAVVYSWEKLGWGAVDLDSLITQELLVKDHLGPYLSAFKKADTTIKRNACLWCVEQLVPLKTMVYTDWLVTTYEDLCQGAENEIEKVLNYIGVEKKSGELNATEIITETVRKDSAILKKQNPLKVWQRELSKNQVDQILGVVKSFSLDRLYDRSVTSHKNNLVKILKHGVSF